jgi:hypothetical protein
MGERIMRTTRRAVKPDRALLQVDLGRGGIN